jgi:hypothetical protein
MRPRTLEVSPHAPALISAEISNLDEHAVDEYKHPIIRSIYVPCMEDI